MLKNNLIDVKILSLLFSNIEDIFNVHRMYLNIVLVINLSMLLF